MVLGTALDNIPLGADTEGLPGAVLLSGGSRSTGVQAQIPSWHPQLERARLFQPP